MAQMDWYENRDQLNPGMIFNTDNGVIQLDRRTPGDRTRWNVLDWHHSHWIDEGSTIEPGDLMGEPLTEEDLELILSHASVMMAM